MAEHDKPFPNRPPAPGGADPQIPAPAPIPVNTPPVTEEITCPLCGERQTKRILCRACACDMPRGIAAKEEEAAAERARRREAFMARHKVSATAPSRAGARTPERTGGQHLRPSADAAWGAADDAPLFGLSFSGRIGRLRNFLGALLGLTGLVALSMLVARFPNRATFVVLVFGGAFVLVWACRLTVLRLHDVGHSGWWLPVFFVPFMGNIGSLALMLWPGHAEENEYGAPPPGESVLPALAALIALCAMLATSWDALSAYQRERAAASSEADGDEEESADAMPAQQAAELARVLHSDAAVEGFRRYMAAPGQRAFAVSEAGAWGWHGGAARPAQAVESALADCDSHRRPYTPACQVVHLNDQWVAN